MILNNANVFKFTFNNVFTLIKSEVLKYEFIHDGFSVNMISTPLEDRMNSFHIGKEIKLLYYYGKNCKVAKKKKKDYGRV